MTNAETQNILDALQTKYVAALDSRDMLAWLDCFDQQDGSYVCIARENEDEALPLALMMDDCYARLRDRVNYVTDVWKGTFEDYLTRHFVQRLTLASVGSSEYAVESNFSVMYTTAQGTSAVLVVGTYVDRIVVRDGIASFKSRRAVLDTTVTPRYLVYPV